MGVVSVRAGLIAANAELAYGIHVGECEQRLFPSMVSILVFVILVESETKHEENNKVQYVQRSLVVVQASSKTIKLVHMCFLSS